MLPHLQAEELKTSILEYLKATFDFRDKEVHEIFYRFIEDPKEGLFKGPYVSLSLPFIKEGGVPGEAPLEIMPPFEPFVHQSKAFNRLSSRNGDPQPTLLTTGTGSGKTESFLFPLFDYCYKHRERKGIKAIILYPMNALATDQAQRIAKEIWSNEKLKGNIRAGLFIGEGKSKVARPTVMGADHIVEDRDSMLASPPDILLTNFKMLDYALMQARFDRLWRQNYADPALLRFLVLDELHTYDGAQGTDVANLIRRIKLKLDIPDQQLCPVGTSATIGSGDDSVKLLTDFASEVFGEHFEPASVIVEERQNEEAFFRGIKSIKRFPEYETAYEARLQDSDTYQSFLAKQCEAWGIEGTDGVRIAQALKQSSLLRDVVHLCRGRILTLSQLIKQLAEINADFGQLPEWDHERKVSPRQLVLDSFLTLISAARVQEGSLEIPFLQMRIQFWVKELSSLLRVVGDEPAFVWRDSSKDGLNEDAPAALPMYFCRSCGASGWLARKKEDADRLQNTVHLVIRDFIQRKKDIYLVNTLTPSHEPTNLDNWSRLEEVLDPVSLQFLPREEKENGLPVIILNQEEERKRKDVCPECDETNVLASVGTRLPTLLSVAVGQSLSSNLDAKLEGDRKVLTFTNEVQDAAHLAGFVQGRNYRFTYRTAIQRVVNQLQEPISLPAFFEQFTQYWRQQPHLNAKEAYYRYFYPDDLEKNAPLEAFKSTGAYPTDFEDEFALRMYWDLLTEYGMNARVGRTLEKTGASVPFVDERIFKEIWADMEPWMQQNNMEAVQKEAFDQFLVGFLYRLRTHGAFDHPYLEKYRNHPIDPFHLNWYRDSRHYLNRIFPKGRRIPKLFTPNNHSRSLLESSYTQRVNWYHTYVQKALPGMSQGNRPLNNEFYQALTTVLVKHGVFTEAIAGTERNYALDPRFWKLSSSVKTLRCNSCDHPIYVAEEEQALKGSACQQYRCKGSYSHEEDTSFNYYQKVYSRQYAPRIYGGDHTGIIDRKSRESKEQRFKGKTPESPLNALMATSTLEMGIDVGNLDVTMTAGVPPLPSNFMQRIGRAGRKSGNALVTNFAKTQPHDLYFFEAPHEMMEGHIHTPGCFLNSPEILRRQFLAYCFDCWSKLDADKNHIPRMVMELKLLTIDLLAPEFFLNRLFQFVEKDPNTLIVRFEEKYDGLLDPELLHKIEQDVQTRAFVEWARKPFSSLKKFIEDIREKRIRVKEQRDKLQKTDPDYELLNKELIALYRLMKSQMNRQVLELMTNYGRLPNYAFPETGISLLGQVYTKAPKGTNAGGTGRNFAKGTTVSYEFIRPASQAIRELAPHNRFYSEGFGFSINGLQVQDWDQEDGPLNEARFCSRCDHIDMIAGEGGKSCPKCGDPSFGAESNVHKFAQFTGAVANDMRHDAFIDDSKEDRFGLQYHISRHYDFSQSPVEESLALIDIPFGIQFAANVVFTEVNLGLKGISAPDTVQLNDQDEVARHGFVCCKHCGYATAKPEEEKKRLTNKENLYKLAFHYPYCSQKDKHYIGEPDEVFEECFLYFTKNTEVLKILLPAQDFATEEKVELFKAGLDLGLKQFFKGNPSHIGFATYQEYNKLTQQFDHYLLLVDRVPGGTGYLKKLFSETAFKQIIELAYRAISSCHCQHEGKDGCYHCVRSYGNQHRSKYLSRSHAEAIFERLRNFSTQWKRLPHGLGDVSKNGKIEESELEDRFIYLFKKYADAQKWAWEEVLEEGIRSYYVTIPQWDESHITYHIRPQIELGKADGLPYSTRTDFLLMPVHSTREDAETVVQGFKHIAVYLDGYQYHASSEHNTFVSDIKKRMGFVRHEKYRVWVLSWSDLNLVDVPNNTYKLDAWDVESEAFKTNIQLIQKSPLKKYLDVIGSFDGRYRNSFIRLMTLLQVDDHHEYQIIGMLNALMMESIQKGGSYSEAEVASLAERITPFKPDNLALPKERDNSFLAGKLSQKNHLFESRFFTHLKDRSTQAFVWVFEDHLLDIQKEEWEAFWQLFNFYQYARKDFKLAFERSLAATQKESVDYEVEPTISLPHSTSTLDIEEDDFTEGLYPIVLKAVEKGLVQSTDYFSLSSAPDLQAEFGIEPLKLVFCPLGDTEKKHFTQAGFTVIEDPKEFNINLI